MFEIQSLLTKDKLAAVLTNACIAKSYEVETTKNIVDMWKQIRDHMKLDGPLDGISMILTSGRIMDLEREVKEAAELDDVIKSIKVKVDRHEPKTVGVREVSAAFLTAACTSHSHEVETTKSIVEFWEALINGVDANDAMGLTAAILATGRIMDIRVDIKSPVMINDIVKNIKDELTKLKVPEFADADVISAFLSAAYIEISPKVEKYRDMVQGWNAVKRDLTLADDKDQVAAILYSGRIKDSDSIIIMRSSSMMEEIKKIRQEI